ncbi:hypothetical protein CGRA01v4_11701 [Colletotrichum graminicola]|nr:hypothetical protein CGRA01v4_11701 [Colletotrichum graminicola]
MLAASTMVTGPRAPCLMPRIRCRLKPKLNELPLEPWGRGGGQTYLFASRPFVGLLRLTTNHLHLVQLGQLDTHYPGMPT